MAILHYATDIMSTEDVPTWSCERLMLRCMAAATHSRALSRVSVFTRRACNILNCSPWKAHTQNNIQWNIFPIFVHLLGDNELTRLSEMIHETNQLTRANSSRCWSCFEMMRASSWVISVLGKYLSTTLTWKIRYKQINNVCHVTAW